MKKLTLVFAATVMLFIGVTLSQAIAAPVAPAAPAKVTITIRCCPPSITIIIYLSGKAVPVTGPFTLEGDQLLAEFDTKSLRDVKTIDISDENAVKGVVPIRLEGKAAKELDVKKLGMIPGSYVISASKNKPGTSTVSFNVKKNYVGHVTLNR